jgi:hypothetical protein
MNNQNQPTDGHWPSGESRIKADDAVTGRFVDLDKALHGTVEAKAGGNVNWNGDDEAEGVFDTFLQDLSKDPSLSEARPTAAALVQQAQAQQAQQAQTQQAQAQKAPPAKSAPAHGSQGGQQASKQTSQQTQDQSDKNQTGS